MADDSKKIVGRAPSVDVRRVGSPEPADVDLAGRAIRFPLSEYPDQEWRRHFGRWGGLRKYFAQIRFEEDGLLLFLGGSAPSVEPALDEVEQAIAKANESRRAESIRSEERTKLFRRKRAKEDAKIENALQAWTQKHPA